MTGTRRTSQVPRRDNRRTNKARLSNRPTSPKTQMEQEKRIRREIANSNERRRMQSINAGFQSLRTLLPHHDGEKLSKAAILQHTAEYIYQLEQEKTRLLSQNSQLKRLLNCQMSQDSDGSSSDSPLPKRKKGDNMDDEGIAGMSPQDTETKEDVLRELVDLRVQLERERRLRMILEDQARGMEAQAYTERIREAPAAAPHHKVKTEEVAEATNAAVVVAQPPLEQQVLATSQFSPAPAPVALPAGSASPPRVHPQPPEPLPSPAADLPQDLSTHSMQPAAPAAVAVTPTVATREEAVVPPLQSSPCTSPYHASTSRQNLETIVEAIRHLEGDHLFRDDEPRSATPEQLSTPEANAGSMLRSSLNVLVVHEPALRQQVIQCGTATRRPGVIVANHS
ncbi:transcription factor AP-4 isoform X2 [Dermacentor albipictus]|uniref:transcription factor AP-4 isoform X2 n=1 Tax=Dermacentor albipictus TaxID=60249 RepID=UPI0031FDB5A6